MTLSPEMTAKINEIASHFAQRIGKEFLLCGMLPDEFIKLYEELLREGVKDVVASALALEFEKHVKEHVRMVGVAVVDRLLHI